MRETDYRDQIIAAHWYLCRRAARRFLRPGLERSDLEQVAAIGLIKAADRYDSGRATPFEAYAWVLMLGELMHYVRDGERLLRAPRRIRDLDRRWSAAERELRTELGREPQERDVATYLNVTPEEQREIREYRASNHIVSYEGLSALDQTNTQFGIDHLLDRMTIDDALSKLSPLERKIVRGIHLDGATVSELAKRLGYSRRHLSRLHRGAMTRLKNVS